MNFFIYFCYFIVYLYKKYNLKIFNLIKLSLLEIQTKIDIKKLKYFTFKKNEHLKDKSDPK